MLAGRGQAPKIREDINPSDQSMQSAPEGGIRGVVEAPTYAEPRKSTGCGDQDRRDADRAEWGVVVRTLQMS